VGSFDLGVFSLTQTNAGNPINLSFDLQIKDADGDTVALPGSINIELDPTAQQASVIHNSVTTNTVNTGSTTSNGPTTHLIPGNDNGSGDHRAFAVGHNAAVMAALAAAGLEAEHSRFDWHALAQGNSSASSAKLAQFESLVASASQASGSVSPTHIVQPVLASHAVESGHGSGHHASVTLGHQQAGDGNAHPLTSGLLHGTSPFAHGPIATAHPIMAPAISMPSAQQLAAALGAHSQVTSVGGEEHSHVVSKVLADALHGGEGNGPSIETLVNSHGGHVTHDVIEALASHAGSSVPFSNSALAAAFHGSHNMFSMSMAHHDAAPHHG
jgi:hypothetical protein